MDRVDVQNWLVDRYRVSRETLAKLDRFAALLEAENHNQNLIARSTVSDLWDRHIRDSAQLLALAPEGARGGRWLDLGSGPGLPGLVLAVIGEMEMVLVESRRKRVDFLERSVVELGLCDRVLVRGTRLENIPVFKADVITARAFAPLPRLLAAAQCFSGHHTIWLLPKGKTVEDELAETRRIWQGKFETVQSATDPASFIVRASGVSRRKR